MTSNERELVLALRIALDWIDVRLTDNVADHDLHVVNTVRNAIAKAEGWSK